MPDISPLNTGLILWGIVTTVLAVLTTPNSERRFEISDIKDAVMDTVRILFVVAWIGTVLALITIGATGPERERTAATPDLDARGGEVR